MRRNFEIQQQTNNWIAVNKSAGLLSIPDRYKPDIPNLQKLLKAQFSNCFTVQRLDKFTSGIMVFALNAEMHQHLNQQFENHQVKKEYLALVHGKVSWQNESLNVPLASNKKKVIVHKNGKASVTEFELIESFKKYSLVSCKPKTGRTHQIRVHLSHLGHPIVGDELYGGQAKLSISDIKPKAVGSNNPILKRQALHAHQLFFTDLKGDEIKLEASLSKDFTVAIKQLKKWSS